MDKNQDMTLVPIDRKYLFDDEAKVGAVHFTAAEQRALLKLTTLPEWEVLKNVYVKQRLVQIAVASVNVSQTETDMWFYKGKSAEAGQFIKDIEKIAKDLKRAEDKKNTPTSKS